MAGRSGRCPFCREVVNVGPLEAPPIPPPPSIFGPGDLPEAPATPVAAVMVDNGVRQVVVDELIATPAPEPPSVPDAPPPAVQTVPPLVLSPVAVEETSAAQLADSPDKTDTSKLRIVGAWKVVGSAPPPVLFLPAPPNNEPPSPSAIPIAERIERDPIAPQRVVMAEAITEAPPTRVIPVAEVALPVTEYAADEISPLEPEPIPPTETPAVVTRSAEAPPTIVRRPSSVKFPAPKPIPTPKIARRRTQAEKLAAYASAVVAVVALVSIIPALGHINLPTAPGWARGVILVSMLLLAYAAWLPTIADRGTFWVTTIVMAAVAAMYGSVMTMSFTTPIDADLPLGLTELRWLAPYWCGAIMTLSACAAYYCGHAAQVLSHRTARA